MVELGHPEQLPCSSTFTIPSLNSLKLISPPSFATAGLIFVYKRFIIFFSISLSSLVFSSKSSFAITNSFPVE